jgi:hypothetical protein
MVLPKPAVTDNSFLQYTGCGLSGESYYQTPYEHSARNFYTTVERRLPSIVGACAFSAQDAFDSHVPGLENNYIETLMEIREILAPLSIPGDFWRFALKSVKNSKNAVFELLELIASTNISYKFGLAPNIDAATELSTSLSGFWMVWLTVYLSPPQPTVYQSGMMLNYHPLLMLISPLGRN